MEGLTVSQSPVRQLEVDRRGPEPTESYQAVENLVPEFRSLSSREALERNLLFRPRAHSFALLRQEALDLALAWAARPESEAERAQGLVSRLVRSLARWYVRLNAQLPR